MQIISCKKECLKDIPSTIGIYIFYNSKNILYIGKSINLKARIFSHFENAKLDSKEAGIISNSQKIKLMPVESEFKALLLESSYIQKYEPKYNRIWRDDKSYLYIKITTKDKYPKINAVRRENDNKSIYFGPFHSVRIINNLLHEIRKSFPFCTQNKIGNKPCFYSKINLCKPCPGEIENTRDKPKKKALRRQYLVGIHQIIKIFSGKTDILLKSFYKKLDKMIVNGQYEEALVLRNRIFTLEKLITERLFLNEDFLTPTKITDSNSSLLKIVIKYFPDVRKIERVECYDISNFGGKYATGSMVVLENAQINKKEYRKFRIRDTDQKNVNSDFAMLSQVVERRFKNPWKLPDLILVDGGKPQVKAVCEALNKINIDMPVIGIAKNPDRLVMGTKNLETEKISYNNQGFNLIRLLRDESHRFSRKYHILLRESKLV